MCAVIMCEQHHIGMGPWIERVLIAPHVICCIVDADNFVSVNTVFDKYHRCSFFVCKWCIVAVILLFQYTVQQVVLKLIIKSLYNKLIRDIF